MIEEIEGGEFLENIDPMATLALPQMRKALKSVLEERVRQDTKWGFFRDFPNGVDRAGDDQTEKEKKSACQTAARLGKVTWRHISDEEIAEVNACTNDKDLEMELIQEAAVLVAWIEAIRRRRDERKPAVYRMPLHLRVKAWFRRRSVKRG